jgi:hypothetical protein
MRIVLLETPFRCSNPRVPFRDFRPFRALCFEKLTTSESSVLAAVFPLDRRQLAQLKGIVCAFSRLWKIALISR